MEAFAGLHVTLAWDRHAYVHWRNMVRSDRFNLRLEPEEAGMLEDLAQALGLTASGLVRMLVRQAHAKHFGVRPPARRTKRTKR
jgi:hypothetical protein